jgi:hypothetical protein
MTQVATPQIGLLSKIYIATTQGTAVSATGGTVTGGTIINFVQKITPPKPKWGTWDKTNLNTPNTGRLKGKTLLDNGEVKIEGFYASADPGQTALAAAFLISPNSTNGDAFGFLIEEPVNLAGGQTTQGDIIVFNATVTEWEIGESETGKEIPFMSTLTVTGPITVTLGT